MKRPLIVLILTLGNLFALFGQPTASDSQGTGPIITVSVPPGSYSSDQLIVMVTDPGVDLYYTFAESRGAMFTRYRFPFTLSAAIGEERSYTRIAMR